MSTPSHKSNAKKIRPVQPPRRANGIARVAAIIAAAESIIEEKGYEATTMAEIAERSNTKIGSLYRFFPNKQSLADTIIVAARKSLDEEFDRFDAAVSSLSIRSLSDALMDLILDRLGKSAAKKLLEIDQNWSIKLEEFKDAILGRIAGALMIHTPGLSKRMAHDIAQVVLLNVKAMAIHHAFLDPATNAKNEFREMIRLYLRSRLSRKKENA